jgi:hypothetical protein
MSTHPLSTQQGDPACLHCGCLDIPRYEQECHKCPGCGAVLDERPPEPVSWLLNFAAPRRSLLANLFCGVIRRGETSPAEILAQVGIEIQRRFAWLTDPDKREFFHQVLSIIDADPKAVKNYTETVLAREQLPAAERVALKEERAKTFIVAAMRDKPATEKQLWLLRSKGYRGTLPADRAEASELIDALLRRTGGRNE